MSYYEKVIQPDEKILYNKKLHWIVYVPACLLLIVSIGVAAVARRNGGDMSHFSLAHLLLLVTLALFVRAWILRFATEIVVTDKRVILKRGLFIVNTMEMNMSKVETVDVLQSIVGQALNYGTIVVRGTGSSYEPLNWVTSPIELRKVIVAK